MNNDLISRRSAIDSIKKCLEVAHDNWEFGEERAYVNAIECLEEEPPIQPQQKTGRWEHDGGHFENRWICSQCGYKFYFEKSEAKYCPNCGAKMESDNEV